MSQPSASVNRFPEARLEWADPFAMQLALSRVHARLVPMRRLEAGYEVDPRAEGWFTLPAGRGLCGYGLGRALRMLLDVLRGLTALHDTFNAAGEPFAHGEVALPQLRVDPEGVCRVLPLTARHSSQAEPLLAPAALGYLAPERLLGERVDARADVFSAGALLWEALAGRRLFEESSADAIVDRLLGAKLQMPHLPPELAWAIPLKVVAARALAVDPYQRFSDCAELATAIAFVARDRIASHTEIASFFAAPARAVEQRATDRPIPSQSSTFSKVGAPSSQHATRVSTLAPLCAATSPASNRLPSLPPIPPAAAPAALSPSSTFEAVATPISILTDEEALSEAAAFRSSPWPKLWTALAVISISGALAVGALTRATPTKIWQASPPVAAAQLDRAASPAEASSEHSRRALPSLNAAQAGANVSRGSDSHSPPVMHASSLAAKQPASGKAAQPGAKDYGI
jgi:hypothetical protein